MRLGKRVITSVAATAATALTAGAVVVATAPEAEALWCPGAVNTGSFSMNIFIGTVVAEYCDWAPPVPGVDSHRHCEYGGYIGYGGRCDWRNSANQIVPPPPGHV